ncbi:SEL1-like repeat protein, partial [Pseudomonadales bacterium]|nr:SEL1-like repeat protein [Pseudomonadales bacterium]
IVQGSHLPAYKMLAYIQILPCEGANTEILISLEEMSSEGYLPAAIWLGAGYLEGELGLERDFTKAKRYLERASRLSKRFKVESDVDSLLMDAIPLDEALALLDREISDARRVEDDRKQQIAAADAQRREALRLQREAEARERRAQTAQKVGSFLGDLFVAALTAYVTVKVVDELVDDTSYVSRRTSSPYSTQRNRVVHAPPVSPVTQDRTNYFSSGAADSNRPSQTRNMFVPSVSQNNFTVSCRCSCVDGEMVSLCNSSAAVPKVCGGYCPVAIQKYQLPSTKAPPPGASQCQIRQVFDYSAGRYVDRDVCF